MNRALLVLPLAASVAALAEEPKAKPAPAGTSTNRKEGSTSRTSGRGTEREPAPAEPPPPPEPKWIRDLRPTDRRKATEPMARPEEVDNEQQEAEEHQPVDGEPPVRENAAIGAGEPHAAFPCSGFTFSAPSRPMTMSRKASPRLAKLSN